MTQLGGARSPLLLVSVSSSFKLEFLELGAEENEESLKRCDRQEWLTGG